MPDAEAEIGMQQKKLALKEQALLLKEKEHALRMREARLVQEERLLDSIAGSNDGSTIIAPIDTTAPDLFFSASASRDSHAGHTCLNCGYVDRAHAGARFCGQCGTAASAGHQSADEAEPNFSPFQIGRQAGVSVGALVGASAGAGRNERCAPITETSHEGPEVVVGPGELVKSLQMQLDTLQQMMLSHGSYTPRVSRPPAHTAASLGRARSRHACSNFRASSLAARGPSSGRLGPRRSSAPTSRAHSRRRRPRARELSRPSRAGSSPATTASWCANCGWCSPTDRT
jgi:hypothetical protein